MKFAAAAAMILSLLALRADSVLAQGEEHYREAREQLAYSIRNYARAIGEDSDPAILAAVRTVPRHLFVPPSIRGRAYADRPLPIGRDQTISQPSLVALMTQLLQPEEGDVILEVGTGSGYQAAILSPLVEHVYSIEIIGELARSAERRLADLGFDNVTVRHGDGYLGWPEHAPFDGIVVTAGADRVPAPLVEQLEPGGRMVIPVGPAGKVQDLRLITKRKDGTVEDRTITAVCFVPLTRERR
jgi:protein-L-isoaspartate(D-aspartate) O-methyltransferase